MGTGVVVVVDPGGKENILPSPLRQDPKTTLLYFSALAVIPARPDFSLTRSSCDNNVFARVG